MINYKRVTNLEASKLNRMYGRSIRINRHDYSFVWCRELVYENTQCQGLCNVEDKVIYIDVSSDVSETLLHEIVHAEFYEAGMRQRNDHDPNLEEQIAEIIAKGLSSAFKFRSK